MSSSSSSPSGGSVGSSPSAPTSGFGPERRRRCRRGCRRHGLRRLPAVRHRLAVAVRHHRHALGVGPGIGRFEIDDVAQENLAVVQLIAPDDDGLEGQRAFAQARDHGFAAGLDALRDRDFALARQQLDRTHLAQIHADRIVGALARLGLLGLGRRLAAHFDEFALGLLLLGLLARFLRGFLGLGLLGLDDVDAHLVEHGEDILDLVGGDFLGWKHRIDLIAGDVAALLGAADQLFDGVVPGVGRRAVRRNLGTVILCGFFLLFHRIGLA